MREARLKAASVYVSDLLRHGDIGEEDYAQELEKSAALPVPAIQALCRSTRLARERASKIVMASAKREHAEASAGCSIPLVITKQGSSKQSLAERLMSEMKLTKDLDALDEMNKR